MTYCHKCFSEDNPPNHPNSALCTKNVCRGHDCSRISRIVGSQRLPHKNLFSKVPLFVLQSTAIRFAKYRSSFRKVQISISQSTDFHFAKSRFPFHKVQISFRSVKYHFAKYSKPLPSNIYIMLRHSQVALNHFLHFRIQLCNIYCCTNVHVKTAKVRVVKISRQPAHFTGYSEYCAGYSELRK